MAAVLCSCGLPVRASRTGKASVCSHCDAGLKGHEAKTCLHCQRALAAALAKYPAR